MSCGGGNGAIAGASGIDPGEISAADFEVTETTLSFCSPDEIPDPPIFECWQDGRGIKKQHPGTCNASAQLCHGHQAGLWPFFREEPYTCTDGAQGVGCYAASDGISCQNDGVCCPCGDIDANGTCKCPGETVQICVQLPTFWQPDSMEDSLLHGGVPPDQFSSWKQTSLGRVDCASNGSCNIAWGSADHETLCGTLEEEEDEETWNGVGVSSACLDAIEDTRRQLQAAAFGSCMERCIDGVLDCMAASNCDDGGSCASSSSYSNCIMGCF